MEQAGSYGQFELLRVFGRGLVTEVFLAREKGATGPKGLVVVHRVLSSVAQNRAFVDAFLDGAAVAGTIKHPNIVEIYDLGEIDGQHFIAQEYVAGGSLLELLDRSGETLLPVGDALFIVGEVCAGLQFAHALAGPDGVPRNLVHGAVNPRHLLVSVDGVVKVADFGMNAAAAILGVPPAGDPRESAAFRAPEQLDGRAVDRRADIYASGALLYRLCTGQLPRSASEGTPLRPREINPSLPAEVEEIILKAMEPSPKDRHPTCGALRREVAKVARNLAIEGDMSTLGVLVRSQFPEVVSLRKDDEGGEEESSKQRSDVLGPAASEPPKHFPAPDVTPAETRRPKPVTLAAPTPPKLDELDDGVPLLADSEVTPLTTGQFEALRTSRLQEMDAADAAAILERGEPAPSERKRPIWLWVLLAGVGGAILATALVLIVIFLVVMPRLEEAVDEGMAMTYPEVAPELTPPSVQPPPVEPPPPDINALTGPASSLGAVEEPKPPDQTGTMSAEQDATKVQPLDPAGLNPTPNGDGGPSKTAPVESSPATPSSPQSDGGPVKSSDPEPSKRSPAGAKGYIYVLTSPTSRVYLDSRLLGTTPILKRAVPAGRHSLVLVSPGFPSKRIALYVPANQVKQVRHLFR